MAYLGVYFAFLRMICEPEWTMHGTIFLPHGRCGGVAETVSTQHDGVNSDLLRMASGRLPNPR